MFCLLLETYFIHGPLNQMGYVGSIDLSPMHETRPHLFIDCSISHHVWSFFVTHTNFTPQMFDDVVIWLVKFAAVN